MKKHLIGSTALVTAGLLVGAGAVQEASAADPITLTLGGYMEQWFGYSDQDDVGGKTDASGVQQLSDTEVFFLGKTTLDNGVEVGVNIQLEGNTSGDQIDESFLFISGAFGEINLGDENSAQYKMGYGSPQAGIGLSSGDVTAWADTTGIGGTAGFFRSPFGSPAYVEVNRLNDVFRVTYYTPRIGGFQFGASYAPANQEDTGGTYDRDAIVHDAWSFGANFVESFNDVDVAVSGGYGTAEAAAGVSDPSVWNVGAQIGFAGFTVGGAYADGDDGTTIGDSQGFEVGASYSTGPVTLAVEYLNGERDAPPVGFGADLDAVHGSVNYALGPGVTIAGTVGYAELDDKSAADDDNDALYIVGGVKLSF